MKSKIVLALIACFLAGCTSQSQLMINPARQTIRCTASGSGIDGLIITNSAMSSCVDDYAKLGYIPIEESGVSGIWMSKPDLSLDITKVAANSPAAKAGIVQGDVLVSVNGEKPINASEAVKLLFGRSGETVTVVVKGSAGQRTLPLILAPYVSLYGAQPAK